MSLEPYLSTLGNGLRVLEALKSGPRGLPDLVRDTGIPRVTVYRILRTLEFHRMVLKDDDRGEYRVTLKLWEFSQAALAEGQRGPVVTAQAEALRDRWGDTVHVAVYERGEVMYINKLDGTMPLRSYTTLGGRAPARCVATGKALLAFQSTAEMTRVIDEPLTGMTHRTITSKRGLGRELDTIRREVTAYNRGEWRDGIGGIASPILTAATPPVAAIGISGPVDRVLDDGHAERAAHVRLAAARIARSLSAADGADTWARYGIDHDGSRADG